MVSFIGQIDLTVTTPPDHGKGMNLLIAKRN